MRPITQQAEPLDFQVNVRDPGLAFLKVIPNPTSKQWEGKEYWQRALSAMRRSYDKICAYSASWIPHSTGSHSIDHFERKSLSPKLAYEWSNFRYVSSRFNSRKGIRVIVDPFTMTFYWFVIDFTTFFIHPNVSTLNADQTALAVRTIEFLQLNDDDELVKERQEFFHYYKAGDISFAYLEIRAPFLAYEIRRQGLA